MPVNALGMAQTITFRISLTVLFVFCKLAGRPFDMLSDTVLVHFTFLKLSDGDLPKYFSEHSIHYIILSF
jgi:hypothetical protein